MADNRKIVQSRPIAHGATRLRGLDIDSVPLGKRTGSIFDFEGRFGRLFPDLPPLAPNDDDLANLAKTMEEPGEPDEDDPINNKTIPAGFTYFGQFIDHDLTFDPSSKLDKMNDPKAIIDFRTPRFDLDSLYGRGPDDQPYLYNTDGSTFLIGQNDVGEDDLQRNARGRALIGDKRNDENLIVSQTHLPFLKYHNKVFSTLRPDTPHRFNEAHRIVRWHYQWIVVHDFLARIVGKDLVTRVLKEGLKIFTKGGKPFVPGDQPFMPVEFAVAAYRLGHSMVRSTYALNTATSGEENELLIFADKGNLEDLRGFRRRPADREIEWHRFFQFDRQRFPAANEEDLQLSMNIDTGLAPGLFVLPSIVVGMGDQPQIQSLAERNLKRGKALGLPSGQDVAQKLADAGVMDPKAILRDVKVKITVKDPKTGFFTKTDDPSKSDNPKLQKLDLAGLSREFGANTPLWYYILYEAEHCNQGKHLGPVGGRIVAEVFIGLLRADKTSYLNAPGGFKPKAGAFGAVAKPPGDRLWGSFSSSGDGDFTMADLIAYVGNII